MCYWLFLIATLKQIFLFKHFYIFALRSCGDLSTMLQIFVSNGIVRSKCDASIAYSSANCRFITLFLENIKTFSCGYPGDFQ